MAVLGVFLAAYYGQLATQTAISFMLRTRVVKAERVERTVSGQGFVLRKDDVVVAPVGGVVEWLVQDGDRVRAGTPVARVVNPRARAELEKRLAQLDRDLAAWDHDNKAQQTQMESELTTQNRQLYDRVAAWREDLVTATATPAALPTGQGGGTGGAGSGSGTGTLARVTEAASSRKATAFKAATLRDERAVLSSERDATAELLRKAALEIPAPGAGVFNHRFDGLEEAMTLPSGQPPEPSKLLNARPKDSEAKSGDKLNPGQRLFRVTDTAKIVIAVVLADRDMAEFTPGEQVSVRFGTGGASEVKSQVSAVGERDQTGMGVVFFATSDFNPELYVTRQAKVSVFRRSPEGPGVPKSALVTKDGATGVFVVERDFTVFHPVTVLAANPTMAVVDGIPVGAQVVTNPWLVPKKGVRIR